MPIVIGPKPNLLNDIAAGWSAASGGYGTGYGQHSGELVRALENKGQAMAAPIQAAATQQAGFFADLAYQHQAQVARAQMQQQTAAAANSRLHPAQLSDINAYSMKMTGMLFDDPSTGGVESSADQYDCSSGTCVLRQPHATQTMTRMPSMGPTTFGGGGAGPLSKVSMPPQLMAGESPQQETQQPFAPTWTRRWMEDPKGAAAGMGRTEYFWNGLQSKQMEAERLAHIKAGDIQRFPGQTQQEVDRNEADYTKAWKQARELLHRPDMIRNPQQAQDAVSQIMTPEIKSKAPGWYPKLQPSPQERAKASILWGEEVYADNPERAKAMTGIPMVFNKDGIPEVMPGFIQARKTQADVMKIQAEAAQTQQETQAAAQEQPKVDLADLVLGQKTIEDLRRGLDPRLAAINSQHVFGENGLPYTKDPKNPNNWIVDEKTANVLHQRKLEAEKQQQEQHKTEMEQEKRIQLRQTQASKAYETAARMSKETGEDGRPTGKINEEELNKHWRRLLRVHGWSEDEIDSQLGGGSGVSPEDFQGGGKGRKIEGVEGVGTWESPYTNWASIKGDPPTGSLLVIGGILYQYRDGKVQKVGVPGPDGHFVSTLNK